MSLTASKMPAQPSALKWSHSRSFLAAHLLHSRCGTVLVAMRQRRTRSLLYGNIQPSAGERSSRLLAAAPAQSSPARERHTTLLFLL